jgi:predicted deacylase
MKRSMEIGNLVIPPGEKRYGPLNVARRADGSDIFVPLMVVNGREDGPVLNISGGCHGDEYEGMEAVRRVFHDCDPNVLKGAIIGVPVLNYAAFEAGQRVSTYDLGNLNRNFPGKEKGFFTQRLAHVYFNQVIRKADYVIDLHGGGNIMALAPMAIYRDIGGDEVAERAEKLVRATGIKMVWRGSGGWTGPISLESQSIGIPAITVELAGEGRYRESVAKRFETVINNVLTTFGMVAGEAELPDQLIRFEGTFINSLHGGFYRQLVDLEETVTEGDRVAVVCDVYGETLEEIRAPFDGIVCSKRTTGYLEPGGWTLMVGKLV